MASLPPPFTAAAREIPGGFLVELAGELDLTAETALVQSIADAERSGPALLIVDLRGLEFIDSTGVRVLIGANRRAGDAGRRFVIVRGDPQVQPLLSISGVDRHIETVDDPSAVNLFTPKVVDGPAVA